ncbi:hypothetical protein AB751O23_BJ_00050 [Chlamydiales bacterium SCGC AB-751-O23]|jgi:hypothetical protein|nr:hypothetical protein AB751O23_BJ_00050 [Chlamydiales bacterium SCGC AB-751-O23]
MKKSKSKTLYFSLAGPIIISFIGLFLIFSTISISRAFHKQSFYRLEQSELKRISDMLLFDLLKHRITTGTKELNPNLQDIQSILDLTPYQVLCEVSLVPLEPAKKQLFKIHLQFHRSTTVHEEVRYALKIK